MQKLAKIDVAINAPFSHLFDIPNETWSLNGYVASQLKAKEMCEGLPTKGGYRVAFNTSDTGYKDSYEKSIPTSAASGECKLRQ